MFCRTYSVEIPTRCSCVIEFIIPKFIEGSTCFERHKAVKAEWEMLCISHSALATAGHHMGI
jgi:hypothetical protein